MPERENGWGMVQVYTGQGKGKTTAAIGLAMRAAGWDRRVLIVQFLKGRETGELHSLERLSPQIEIVQMGTGGFLRPGEESSDLKQMTEQGLALAREAIASGEYHLVVLDEVLVAVHIGLLALRDVLQLIREKPPGVELVLTGRGAAPEIEAEADLVTYMTEVKHPFRRGIEARKGVDY